MVILNGLIIAALTIMLLRSLFLTVRGMDKRKKMIMNGIILIFLSFIIYTSLFTYNPEISLESNFSGIIGSYISEAIYSGFGISSYLLPLILIIGAIALITDKVRKIFIKAGGFYLWLFLIVLLVQSIHPGITNESRGVVGASVGEFLLSYLNTGGSIALIVFLGLFSLYLYMHSYLDFTWTEKVISFVRTRREKRRERTEKIKKEREKKKIEEEERRKREREKIKREKEEKARKKLEEKEKVEKGTEKEKVIEKSEIESFEMRDEEFKEKFLDKLNNPVELEWMSEETIDEYKKIIEDKLDNFGVTGHITGVLRGPVVSRFEFKPDPGIKLSKISNLSSDLALALKAEKIRIIAPIPGKGVVGIEVPNKNREVVFLKDLIENKKFMTNPSITYIPVGKDITGDPFYTSISSMPHLLIAGATGSGKSVFINSLITSLLYKAKPEDLRLILLDPKRIELSVYNGIPHLIRSVIQEHSTAVQFLEKSIECMEKRYEEFARVGVRNIRGYNEKMKDKKPYIFIIVDELADLMMKRGKDVENAIIRLAQMSRAVGIHLILATQRPSVDVITGLIKANFPARVAFQVASGHDSKTIINSKGAEQLLGNGDMLFMPPDEGVPKRLHGPFITTEETRNIVSLVASKHLRQLLEGKFKEPDRIVNLIKKEEVFDVIADRSQPGSAERIEEFSKLLGRKMGIEEEKFTSFLEKIDYYPPTEEIEEFLELNELVEELDEVDELFKEAKEIVIDRQSASVSLLQRKLKVGYARAGRIIDQLERAGIVGKFRGSKPREVLVKRDEMQ